jgi:hypothetical protein
MALPAWLIPALISLIPMLFGGKKDEQTQDTTQDTTQTTVTPPWQPKDPGYNIMSPYLMSMLTQNMGRLSGAGFPGGKGIGGDMTQSIIDLIGKSWPDIMGNAGKTATPIQPTQPSIEDSQYCENLCKNPATTSGLPYAQCFSQCIAGRQRR